MTDMIDIFIDYKETVMSLIIVMQRYPRILSVMPLHILTQLA